MFHMSFGWQEPKKTILECSKQILQVYNSLHEYDCNTFHELVHSGKKMFKLDFSKNEELVAFDIANQFIDANKRDLKKYTDVEVLNPQMYGEQIGNSFSFWISYEKKNKIGLTFRLGTYNGGENSVALNLNMNNFEEYSSNWFIDVFRIIIKVLNPYCASFYQYKFGKEYLFDNEITKEFRTGWLLYISKSFCCIENIPSEIDFINLPYGELFITTKDKFSKDNPEHVSKALRLKEFLLQNNYFKNYDSRMTEPNPYKLSFI